MTPAVRSSVHFRYRSNGKVTGWSTATVCDVDRFAVQSRERTSSNNDYYWSRIEMYMRESEISK